MKDYRVYLWLAYLITFAVLLLNLTIPLTRYYLLLRKKAKTASTLKKLC